MKLESLCSSFSFCCSFLWIRIEREIAVKYGGISPLRYFHSSDERKTWRSARDARVFSRSII